MPKPKRSETKYPNVFKLPDGRYWIRAQIKDRATGKDRESSRFLKLTEATTAEEAVPFQLRLAQDLRSTGPVVEDRKRERFAEYAQRWLEERWSLDIIKSVATKRRYKAELRHLNQKWGEVYLDMIKKDAVRQWRVELGKLMKAAHPETGKPLLSPWTVKGRLSLFKLIMFAASDEYGFKDPSQKLLAAPTKDHRVYTAEEPNSLQPAELARFLAYVRVHFRRHYAMLCLGFFTGRRPCELRPLRKSGPKSDIHWETGVLHIRRSQVRGEKDDPADPNERTKTGKDLQIALPPGLVEELRRHSLETAGDSELFFPGRGKGGFVSERVLDHTIEKTCAALGITKHLTPRMMRRTVQDIARNAELQLVVLTSLTGHATTAMVMHYSTPYASEQRAGISAMAKRAGIDFDGPTAPVEDDQKKAA